MADRGGVVSLTIDGITEDCKALAVIRPTGFQRESIVGPDGYHGTILKGAAPGADITITDRGNLEVTRLQNLVSTTVIIELANGKLYQLTNASVLDQVELNPETAEIPLTLACEHCEEITALNM